MLKREDFMKYFEKFPIIEYPIKYNTVFDKNNKGDLIEYAKTVDLNVRYRILDDIKNNQLTTYDYVWKDGDRPDIVAHLYYGDFYYDWLVLLSANAFDWIHDLPLSDKELSLYIEAKYNITIEESFSQIHHYEDSNGFIIDYNTYFYAPEPKFIKYVYDHEFEQNELRRNIKLISRNYLSVINKQFETLIKSINTLRNNNGKS